MIKNQSFINMDAIEYDETNHISTKKIYRLPATKNYFDDKLNSDYNFDNFVEAGCNMLARSAGIIVGNNPGFNEFNPLIICGDSGLGKTHLGNAIGNLIKVKIPEKNILFVDARVFQNKFADSFRNKKEEDFLHFYKMTDVLILDDVHEFAGKERLLDSFLEFFNKLIHQGKQLILISNLPKDHQNFGKRVLSLFNRGICVAIQKPDYDARLGILKKKAYEYQIGLSDDILEQIAFNVTKDIRDLESVLFSLYAQSTINSKEITPELVNQIIEILPGISRREITIEFVQKNVCDYYNVPLDEMFGRLRTKEIVKARQVSMFFSKRLTKASLANIGVRTGGRNHATVIHACNAVCKHIKDSMQFSNQIKDLEKKLRFSIF